MRGRKFPLVTVVVVTALLVVGTTLATPGEDAGQFEDRIKIAQEAAPDPAPDTPDLSPDEVALQGELRAIGEGFDGTVGIAVTDAQSYATMAYNGGMACQRQSVSKLWVGVTALDRVDEGVLDLREPVTIRREDLTLFHQPIRNIVVTRGSFTSDYGDLMIRALTGSDNTANDRLLRRVGGPPAVEGFLRRNAIRGVQFGTDERSKQSEIAGLDWRQDYAVGRAFYEARDAVPERERRQAFEAYLDDPIDGATPDGMALALARLVRGDLLSRPSTQFLLDTLEKTRSGPRRLKGGVPAGWSFGHKTGTGQEFGGIQSGYNDVGILSAPDGTTYGLAVFIQSTRASYAARMAMMQEVTRAVVRHHQSRQQDVADPADPESTS